MLFYLFFHDKLNLALSFEIRVHCVITYSQSIFNNRCSWCSETWPGQSWWGSEEEVGYMLLFLTARWTNDKSKIQEEVLQKDLRTSCWNALYNNIPDHFRATFIVCTAHFVLFTFWRCCHWRSYILNPYQSAISHFTYDVSKAQQQKTVRFILSVSESVGNAY